MGSSTRASVQSSRRIWPPVGVAARWCPRPIGSSARFNALGEVKAPEDVWPAVRQRIAAVDRTGFLQRRRARRVKLVSIPALALLAAGIVMLFMRPSVTDWPLENAFNRQDREYLRYVQAYSRFQSQQSLDPDAMRISEELSREKVLRGE
jgi:hypothetical protein